MLIKLYSKMDFGTILLILDKTLRRKFGVEETNKFLVDFMSRSVDMGSITKSTANDYLKMYGCNLRATCQGCIDQQPNQLAHVDPGGCLYVSENDS